MRPIFDQLLDAAEDDDPHVRGRALKELSRLDLEPVADAAKVKFSKRMSSLPLPKRERRKVKTQPVPEPVIRHIGIKGFLRSMAKGEAMERAFKEMTTVTNQMPSSPATEAFPCFVPEMPRTPGVKILTETPIEIGLARRAR